MCTDCVIPTGQLAGYSQLLKQTQVTLLSLDNCKAYENYNYVTQNMVCAASPDWSTDACQVSEMKCVCDCACMYVYTHFVFSKLKCC